MQLKQCGDLKKILANVPDDKPIYFHLIKETMIESFEPEGEWSLGENGELILNIEPEWLAIQV